MTCRAAVAACFRSAGDRALEAAGASTSAVNGSTSDPSIHADHARSTFGDAVPEAQV